MVSGLCTMTRMKNLLLALVAAIGIAAPVHASVGPQPAPAAAQIEAPRDRLFRGAIQLKVDATDTVHKIFRVRETIPVQKPGAMVLLYPQWETGSHSPTQEAAPLAGLVINAGAQRLDWQRDPVNPFAFRINVPAGVSELAVEFQFLPGLYG